MNRTLVIVADSSQARLYRMEAVDAPRVHGKLIELKSLSNPDLKTLGTSVTGRPATETNTNRAAGPVHPIGAQRERHRLEHERRFANDIAREAAAVVKEWKTGAVVLISGPTLLGFLREPLRSALQQGIELKELAKDYTHLEPAELHEHLTLNRLIPAR